MQKWLKDEKEALLAERHRVAATTTTTVDAHARAQNGREERRGETGTRGERGNGRVGGWVVKVVRVGYAVSLKPGYVDIIVMMRFPTLGPK